MIIANSNIFRIQVASKREDLRSPITLENAYRTGSVMTAVHSAVKDIEAIGEGAVFMIERYSDRFGWSEVQCGEIKDGRYCPRNNF